MSEFCTVSGIGTEVDKLAGIIAEAVSNVRRQLSEEALGLSDRLHMGLKIDS